MLCLKLGLSFLDNQEIWSYDPLGGLIYPLEELKLQRVTKKS